MNKERTNWQGLKKGTRFKVVNNTNIHNYRIGTIYTMKRNGSNSVEMNDIASEFVGNNLSIHDVIILLDLSDMKIYANSLKKEVNKIENEVVRINDIIKFHIDNGIEEYDEELYTLYMAIESMNSGSTMEKVKALQKILKQ